MTLRLVMVMLTVGVMAFAPAPFPRSRGRADPTEISLRTFQGTWKIVKRQEAGQQGQYYPQSIGTVTHIRIADDLWSFMPDTYPGARLNIAIDSTKRPVQLNFYSPSDPKRSVYGVALMRRQENTIEILYTWGGEPNRSLAFETPKNGHWLMILERVK